MQLALYRAERPEIFEEIIGQKQIVRILQNQIKSGTVSQAYLFTGTRGTGKTTTARLLAKALNCLEAEQNEAGGLESQNGAVPCGRCDNCEAIREGKFIDVIELDAASNNSVDDIRGITELVKYPPTIGRYKVFIIDEVHMLSPGAENAFLKTLEEPPEYAIFILATTDPQKVRQTIKSRCMQLNFKRVSESELAEGMHRICVKKGVDASEEALTTIASKADGSVRDALSILEQCIAAGDTKLDRNMVLEYTGSAGEDFYLALTKEVHNGNLGRVLTYIDEIIKRGKDAKQILKDWLEHYRNLMIVKYVSKPDKILSVSKENISRLKAQADGIDIKVIEKSIRLISEYINIGRYSERPRILLETVAVRLSGTGEAGLADESEIGTKAVINNRAKQGLGDDSSSSGSLNNQKDLKRGNENTAVNTRENRKAGNSSNTKANRSAMVEASTEDEISKIQPMPAGDAEDMWNAIVKAVSKLESSFNNLVGNNSIAESYENGELIVRVKKNKLAIAEKNTKQIRDIAKKMFGENTVVTLRGGEILAIEQGFAPEQETDNSDTEAVETSQEDRVSALTEDLGELFGMDIEVVDK